MIRKEFQWYNEVPSRVTRNAIDDLDNAFKHFFRRVKAKQKAGFPRFKKKDIKDSFALREAEKFKVYERELQIEKLKSKMRQKLRFQGKPKQVTISKRADKYFVSILVETHDYNSNDIDRKQSVGVDFGIKALAVLRNCVVVVANRFFPSSKTCSCCGKVKENITLAERLFNCECGFSADRDLNAALNLNQYGLDTLQPDLKCTLEQSQTLDLSKAFVLTV